MSILSHKKIPGLGSLAEQGDYTGTWLSQLPLQHALEQEHDTDAHFVTYAIVDENGEHTPTVRLKKSILADLREDRFDVVVTSLVLDYDNPGHARWTPSTLAGFLREIERLAESDLPNAWLLRRYSALYTTAHGARFIYVLEQPVPADDAEQRLRTLIAKFHGLGVMVDEACSDWTRLFRLPKVARHAERTWEQDYFRFCPQFEARLNLAHVPPQIRAEEVAPIKRLNADQPGADEAEAMLWTERDGKRVRTSWYSMAKKRLKGRECFDCIFGSEPIAKEEERNPTIMKYAGQVVSLLHRREGTTAEKCYALLAPAAMQLDGDDGGRPWLDTLWHAVKHAWERESGKAEQRERKREREETSRQSERALILEGARKWCASLVDDAIAEDDDRLWEWLSRRMIVSRERKFFVLAKTGYYDTTQVGKDMLKAHIRTLDMDDHLDYWSYDDEGNRIASRSVSRLLEDHAWAASDVVGRADLPGALLEFEDTGRSRLVVPLFRIRTDITPRFDDDVDEWLRILFRDSYSKGCLWIGMALLDFSAPICALSLEGPQGCGKKMLTQGLAECISSGEIAHGHEMVSDYQHAVARTPFLNINEGFPKGFRNDPADVFRRWTSGDPIVVNGKYQVPLVVKSPLRIVITANNDDVIRSLTAGRNVSMGDRDAIGIRLMHIRIPEDAGRLLTAKGGREWTHRWIDGDNGSRGDARIARHFLWLREQAKSLPRGKRFLVEGDLSQKVVQDMIVGSGVGPDVVETVADMIERRGMYSGIRGIHIDDENGSFYVTAAAVVDFWNRSFATKRKNRGAGMHHRAVKQVLASLMHRGWREGRYWIVDDATGKKRQARWWLLDNRAILSAAEDYGFPCERLRTFVERQHLQKHCEDYASVQQANRTKGENNT